MCARMHVCCWFWHCLSRNWLQEGGSNSHTHSTTPRPLCDTSNFAPKAGFSPSALTTAWGRLVFATLLRASTIIVPQKTGSSPFITIFLCTLVFTVYFFIFIFRQAVWCLGPGLIRIIRRVLWRLKPQKSNTGHWNQACTFQTEETQTKVNNHMTETN